MKLSFTAPTPTAPIAPPLPYRDPDDTPCAVVGAEHDPDWPDRPVWLDRYLRCSVETEYPDWPPSLTQIRQLHARGLPVPPTWVEAKWYLTRKRTPGERVTTRRLAVAP